MKLIKSKFDIASAGEMQYEMEVECGVKQSLESIAKEWFNDCYRHNCKTYDGELPESCFSIGYTNRNRSVKVYYDENTGDFYGVIMK